MSVQPGQRYRDRTGPQPQIVTVERVEGDQVHGTYAPENAAPALGANTWHISAIEAMELLENDRSERGH